MAHHGEGLLKLTKNEALVNQLKSDYTLADISPAQMEMLNYAAKLTERFSKFTASTPNLLLPMYCSIKQLCLENPQSGGPIVK